MNRMGKTMQQRNVFPSGMLFLSLQLVVSACRSTDPADVIRRWADAAQAGDYSTARAYMEPDDFAFRLWSERTETLRRRQWLTSYTIEQPEPARMGMIATVRWDGLKGPICITVHAGTDQKIVVLDDYHECSGS